jgi:uncharacterized membrane protein YhaH (DUF805 family)
MDAKQLIENFIDVVTNHYIDFQGRAARAKFWHYVLVYVAIAVVFAVLRIRILSSLLALGLFLPSLGIGVRRLHDIDKTGWLVLLPIVPAFLAAFFMFMSTSLAALLGLVSIGCWAYLIYLYAQPGMAGPNQYGADPAASSA